MATQKDKWSVEDDGLGWWCKRLKCCFGMCTGERYDEYVRACVRKERKERWRERERRRDEMRECVRVIGVRCVRCVCQQSTNKRVTRKRQR